MTSLLLLALLPLWILCSAGDHLQTLSPRDVKFISMDYRNVLHWKPPANSSSDLQYYVQWKIYGEKQWSHVDGCQGISHFTCDLSLVTSEPKEWYYAQVYGSQHSRRSPWVISPRFNPSWETFVSSPMLSPRVKEQRIVVRLRPPRTPYKTANGRRMSMAKLQRLTYKVYLIHTSGEEEVFEMEGCSKQLVIPDLSPKTRYCLQAQTLQPLLGRRSQRSHLNCVSTL